MFSFIEWPHSTTCGSSLWQPRCSSAASGKRSIASCYRKGWTKNSLTERISVAVHSNVGLTFLPTTVNFKFGAIFSKRILFLSCFKAQNRDPTYYWTNGVGCNPFTFLERLHPSPHCSQEEPDENCISAVAVWRRDEHSDQAGGQPSTPGSTGRTWWDGEPAAGKRSSRQRSYQGHTETETLFNTLPHSSDTCFYWHGCSSSSCSRCLTLWP